MYIHRIYTYVCAYVCMFVSMDKMIVVFFKGVMYECALYPCE